MVFEMARPTPGAICRALSRASMAPCCTALAATIIAPATLCSASSEAGTAEGSLTDAGVASDFGSLDIRVSSNWSCKSRKSFQSHRTIRKLERGASRQLLLGDVVHSTTLDRRSTGDGESWLETNNNRQADEQRHGPWLIVVEADTDR